MDFEPLYLDEEVTKVYMTFGNIIEHYQNRDNYPTTRTETQQLTAYSLEELYGYMAGFRIQHEQGKVERYGEYTTVEFSPIYEVVAEHDSSLYENHERWIKHRQEMKVKEEREQQEKFQQEQKKALQKEQQEQAEYLRLKAKYEGDNHE